ncbi:PA2778 family cysteine peptidase [Aestuariirhabdus litorea]|nr:PA2778 family cysteine peptidase [Aestuariirhabdus litorea]
MAGALARVAALLAIALLMGCASRPDSIDTTGLASLTPHRQLDNIPYFPQIEDQCGPASLATLLAAQGVDISAEALRGKVYIPGKEGAVTTEMIARARRYGMLTYVLRPELSDLLMEVDAGHPVLVLQNLAFDWMPRWHFSVVVGYDLPRQTISLRSGEELNHEIGFELFLKIWRRADSWAMVALPAGQLPATARRTATLRAANDLEQVGESRAALQVYQSIIERWPDADTAYFGAGNSAYALGQYRASQRFFSAYLRQQPSAAAGWNNLAYSLVALECRSQALAAIGCAVKQAPGNPAIQESEAELRKRLPLPSTASDCPQVQCPLE